ncbi:putative uncharacterized protein DDB_G0282133 [Coccinella septempunctata]|uniref:putative uncharacterized protein DDB_G0282133 n=1 Tax=Coccinella septempunctata TaxID=41139 RepID=UPI001D08C67A|nr:putative uncharacterized protein DDB_G0282133 [Coccinella septempunctata]
MPKDNKKKIWEKERRDHLKEAFLKLEKLLPSYDPSNSASRIDVLTKSIEYIQEMKNVIEELSKPQSEINPKVLKLKNLQDRIKRLVNRMEILSRLLREANIPIPNAHSWKEFKNKKYKWSGKINDGKVLVNNPKMEKKNGINEDEDNKLRTVNKGTESKLNASSLVPKHRKNIVNRLKSKTTLKQKPLQPANSNCLIIYTQAYNTSSCYLVTSAPSSNLPGCSQTVITDSVGASNPVMTTNVKENKKSAIQSNSKVQSLGAGTLILTNGSIYPILPQSQPVLPTPMLVQVTNNSNVIKSESEAYNKNRNMDPNTPKKSKGTIKKTVKQSNILAKNTCNTSNKNLIPQVCVKSKLPPNILPYGPSLVLSKNTCLLPSQMSRVLIPNSANNLKPKTILTGMHKRRIVGKRIRDKPVSRQALKRIGKLARKKETEEKEKMMQKLKEANFSSDVVGKTQGKISDKLPSNMENLKITRGDEINAVRIENADNSEENLNSQNIDCQKTISIISDDIITAPNQNVTSVFQGDSETISNSAAQTSQSTAIRDNDMSISNADRKISETDQKDLNYVEKHSLEKNCDQSIIETHAEPSQLANNPSDVPDEHLGNEEDIGKVESSEKVHKNDNESENMNILTVQNSDQNLRPESSSVLHNECNINQQLKSLDIHLGHSELSNDIFASLQVPPGCQNPESTSPTAAFLLSFPLVSSLTGVKVTEVMDEDNPDSQRETPTLLQIGTMNTTKSVQSETFNSNLLNLDFFSSKDIYNGFYNSFEQHLSSLTMLTSSNLSDLKHTEKSTNNSKSGDNCKPMNNIDNIHEPNVSKQTSMNEQISSSRNTNLHNNRDFLSSNINCQPSFNFAGKQSESGAEIKDQVPSITYSHKSIRHSDSVKETTTTKDNHDVPTEKNREVVEKAPNPLQIDQNIQSNVEFPKNTASKGDSSSLKNVKQTNNSFMKRGACDNIFNIDDINNNMSNVHQNIDQVINFYPEKQKSMTSGNFTPGNSTMKNNNIQPLFQENIHNAQMDFMSNKNFAVAPIHSNPNSFGIENNKNLNKDSNFNIPNQQISCTDKAIIQPYFIPDNKNYQRISNQSNTKTLTEESRNTEAHKYFNYNNFSSEMKKPNKNHEMNFDFNLENKIAPVPKIIESKEITPGYSMPYSNSIYDINNITKVCTCAYGSNKPTSEPVYTNSNSNTYNYYSNSETYMGETYYKNVKSDATYKKPDFSNAYYPDNLKRNITSSKTENIQEKSTYNWMTTPTKSTSDNVVSSFPKDDIVYSNSNLISGNQTNYFTSSVYPTELNSNLSQTSKKTFDLPLVNVNYQKVETEDGQNQFSWSPTKMPQFLDPIPSFVSSTLPTLVGDLALGSSNFTDQKYQFTNKCSKESKNKAAPKMTFENQNNLFSVSQLVHQNDKTVAAKPMRRRNSGSASKSNQMKNKKIGKSNEEQKDVSQCFNKSPGSQNQAKIENKTFNCRQSNSNSFCDKRSSLKVSSSIYSAEALISHHGHSENNIKKDQTFSGNTMKNIPVPPYIPDNIMPYFPSVDLQQDNLIQQNQNYQNFPNFSTFSNNTYSTNTFIPSSTITTPYISSSTFVSDIGVVNDFSSENMSLFPTTPINKTKMIAKNSSGQREEKINPCTNIATKKIKRKPSNEINVTSSLVDFPFLSVPGNINSPLLPEDFHTHSTYLPPPPTQPQLYPCKNTLYPSKQSTITSTAPLLPLPPIPPVSRSGIQHPEISPSLNSAGTSSLTNFNLSTIFPEINKSSMPDVYSQNQTKDQGSHRHYPNSSVPFNSKRTFTYPNCPITQSYGIDNR